MIYKCKAGNEKEHMSKQDLNWERFYIPYQTYLFYFVADDSKSHCDI